MFLGIDLGTSGMKVLICSDRQEVLAEATSPISKLDTPPPFSEQDPESWIAALQSALKRIRATSPDLLGKIRGIGLSGHMHGAVLLGADDRVLRPCIMWDDGRSATECDELDAMADFRGIAGNLVMAGFTAPKLRWVEKHEPDLFAKIAKVLLPKDYLRLWLTGEHGAEMSDAAGTLWLDPRARDWSDPLLEATHLERAQMPALFEGTEVTGTLRPGLCAEWGFAPGTVVAGGAGDNAAAACGMGIVEDGAFLSLGTSGVVFAPTKAFQPHVAKGTHAFCHAVPDTWHQMGVILAAASCLDWQARILGCDVPTMLARLPQRIDGPGAVTFLPYLTGVRTPHNNPHAQASFHNIADRTEPEDMIRAVLEGVGYALKDCVEALSEGGSEIAEAYAVGGGSRSALWLQMLADICNLRLLTPEHGEYGAAFGAARLGMAATHGAYDRAMFTKPPVKQVFSPRAEAVAAYGEAHKGFQALYRGMA